MKHKLSAILLISAVMLAGCSSKGLSGNNASPNNNSGNQSTVSSQSLAAGDNSSASAEQRVQIKTDFSPVKPGSIPQLSGVQKAQVNVKLNATLKDLDNTLKTIQDAPDIDLSSIN